MVALTPDETVLAWLLAAVFLFFLGMLRLMRTRLVRRHATADACTRPGQYRVVHPRVAQMLGEPWVRTWQYCEHKPIPVWVFQKFHDLGDLEGRSAALGPDMLHAVPGDWFILLSEQRVTVLTAEAYMVERMTRDAEGLPR